MLTGAGRNLDTLRRCPAADYAGLFPYQESRKCARLGSAGEGYIRFRLMPMAIARYLDEVANCPTAVGGGSLACLGPGLHVSAQEGSDESSDRIYH
jgi:hypothetical protein